jgi:hypothetical protein
MDAKEVRAKVCQYLDVGEYFEAVRFTRANHPAGIGLNQSRNYVDHVRMQMCLDRTVPLKKEDKEKLGE